MALDPFQTRVADQVEAAVGQTAAILIGWGVASYPYLIFPSVTLAGAAAAPQVQLAILVGAALGLLILVPSLWLLFSLIARRPAQGRPLFGRAAG